MSLDALAETKHVIALAKPYIDNLTSISTVIQ